MFYTIYKITNQINNKYYIGKHITKNLDDGYMGSGKLIRRAIKKYGVENFTKEILEILDDEQSMNNREKELVVISEDSYNLCPGGHGGFGYINNNNIKDPNQVIQASKRHHILFKTNKEYRERCMESVTISNRDPIINAKRRESLIRTYAEKGSPWLGRKHTEESISKMRKSKNVGEKNAQYGTCWITNGIINKKIKKEEFGEWSSLGYTKGRTC
jgi:hypothetical protein